MIRNITKWMKAASKVSTSVVGLLIATIAFALVVSSTANAQKPSASASTTMAKDPQTEACLTGEVTASGAPCRANAVCPHCSSAKLTDKTNPVRDSSGSAVGAEAGGGLVTEPAKGADGGQ